MSTFTKEQATTLLNIFQENKKVFSVQTSSAGDAVYAELYDGYGRRIGTIWIDDDGSFRRLEIK